MLLAKRRSLPKALLSILQTQVSLQKLTSPASQISAVGFTDYEYEKKNFRVPAPEFFNFSRDVIGHWAQSHKIKSQNPAFWWVDDNNKEIKWSFEDLHSHSQRVANIMSGVCKVRPGDRVIVILPRIPQWWLINLAAIRTGAVLIPGTTLLSEGDICQRIIASGTKCIFTDEYTADKVDEIMKNCPTLETKVVVTEDAYYKRPGWLNFTEHYNLVSHDHDCVNTKGSDPMTIFFTSGTTARPKMAEHTHASYGCGHVTAGRHWLDLSPSDVHWNLSDPGWAKSAWSNLFAPWIQGACVFIHHTPSFNPQHVMEMMTKYPVTTFCAAPTVYRMMIQQDSSKYNLASLRHFVSAGEPLNPEVTDRWMDISGETIREGYGQSETALQCASFRCIPNKPGSMGKPAPGIDLTVIGADGKELGPEKQGDFAIRVKPERPVGFFTRYVDEPERTKACYKGDFYLTGDLGYKDEDGYFWFVGRSDDVIISAGYRISPFEVESALLEHPAVAEAAAVSSPDSTRGAVVKAFVILTADYKDVEKENLIRQLQQHMKRVTAPYKYARKIEFVDSLPKTVSLKIRRVELRNKEWGN